jgi:tetratricopeptide (TPR) repeat protein
LIEGRHVLLRQGEGLIEPGGQLRFDFAASEQTDQTESNSPEIFSLENEAASRLLAFSHDPLSFPPADLVREDSDDLLEAVYECEDRGDLTAAIDHCRVILARDGMRADICFQLGELLYRDGQVEAARERYFCAIELDESFVEARTSLACVLAETGRHDLAIAALRGVLSLYEDCPDAHYHLATILEEMGENEEAAQHWQRLQQIAPESPWVQPTTDT